MQITPIFRISATLAGDDDDELMNWFCGMVDRRITFSLISSRDDCQRSSPSRINDTPRAGFEPAQNLSSGLAEWSSAVIVKCLNYTLLLLHLFITHLVIYNNYVINLCPRQYLFVHTNNEFPEKCLKKELT